VETELKFQIPQGQREAVHAAVLALGADCTRLQAVYADTADQRLAKAGLALRLRLEGEHWVQTLKGRGDGMLQRQEDEVPLGMAAVAPAFDPQRHRDSEVGQQLLLLLADGAALQEVYRTDIDRLHANVRAPTWAAGPDSPASSQSRIELALDRGQILANGQRREVHEIEFELKSGSVQDLLAVVRPWLQQHQLWWDVRTKSEMGYRLAFNQRTKAAVTGPATTASATLMQCLQHALPNAAEIADGLGQTAHAEQLHLALQQLMAWMERQPQAGDVASVADIDCRSPQQVRAHSLQLFLLQALQAACVIREGDAEQVPASVRALV